MSAYTELIRNFDKVKDYVREFYILGFKTRDSYDVKSKRTYDNEKRRIESWLSGYIHSENTGHKKMVSVKVDSSEISGNPLYRCWKSKSYTDNDITLHFLLMDILDTENGMTVSEITDRILKDYDIMFDIQIVRIKLKEYCDEGLLTACKSGKNILFMKSGKSTGEIIDKYEGIKELISFYSEEIPFGVVGSFLSDKVNHVNNIFKRKHAYMVHTLDDEILLSVINAINEKHQVVLSCIGTKSRNIYNISAVLLKVHFSVQTGRNYVVIYNLDTNRLNSVRIDSIKSIKKVGTSKKYDTYYEYYKTNKKYLWGTSFGDLRKYGQTEHIHFEVQIDEKSEYFVVQRLIREGRSGTVTKIKDGRYAFDIDLFDANEASPWIKTFIGRIVQFTTDNQELQKRFNDDIQALCDIYGG